MPDPALRDASRSLAFAQKPARGEGMPADALEMLREHEETLRAGRPIRE